MQIGDRKIGVDQAPYIIAEIGVNHDGEVARALELTDAAADAGADAVKLQFFETDRLMSKAAKLAAYQKNAGETDPIEMLRRLELTIDEMALVVDRAHERGIHAIVTVFSTELVEIAETLAWDAYKTASPDIVNRPLLEALAATGKPMIVSTGASELDELPIAESAIWRGDVIGFLQCVSCYPTKPDDASIGGVYCIADDYLRFWDAPEVYGLGPLAGYSDHTQSLDTGALAVRIGACILEKHLTYSRNAHGPDHNASLEPDQLTEYIRLAHTSVRFECESYSGRAYFSPTRDEVELILKTDPRYGPIEKRVLDCEQDVREVSRQSVVSACDIESGTTISRDMLTIKRPGTGILAFEIDTVVGRVATRAIEADVPIVEEDLECLKSSKKSWWSRVLGRSSGC